MILDKNAKQAKIYRWFYGEDRMPVSLCPYFWKLVIMWITIIPVTFISLPMFVWKEKTNVVVKIFGGLFMYGVLFLGFCASLVIASVFGLTLQYEGLLYQWRNAGIFVWVIGIGFSIYYGLGYLHKQFKDRRIEKHKEFIYDYDVDDNVWTGRRWYYNDNGDKVYIEPKKYILIEFIKSSYNKYCPKITWK